MSDEDKTYSPPDDRTRIVGGSGRRRRAASADPLWPPEGERIASSPAADWTQMAGAAPRPRRASGPGSRDAVPVLARRRTMAVPNQNVIVKAAAPLLLTLGSLRVSLVETPIGDLMPEVADAIVDFEADIRSAGVAEGQARTAKYILCATADDIVQNRPGDQQVWTQYSMLSQFFGERNGGVQFFRELDRLRADPEPNHDLLELLHACLALGFEGMHRTSAGNAGALQQIQRNLYETLRRVRRPDPVLSPHWQGRPIAAYAQRFEVPIWVITALLGVALLALYLLLRTWLASATGAAIQAAGTLFPTSDVSVVRAQDAVPPPPPAPPPATRPQRQQIERVKAALASDIAGGKVSVQQTGDRIIVRLGSLGLFPSAEATLEPAFAPVGATIAAMLNKETGPIRVTGHTDNSPLKSLKFASNFDLSLARAKAVAAVLRGGLSRPDRLEVEGKGSDVPIATNDTVEGRAQNRRVEISIPRVD
ncbi:MAG TPA: type VI secretion system protein TssL, long form [Lichenihabitans sp.]|jgi:type VI secretion system protein ImpK|nr:type VI secretion system protein TssL, long form [Lichenihabitans sp.]